MESLRYLQTPTQLVSPLHPSQRDAHLSGTCACHRRGLWALWPDVMTVLSWCDPRWAEAVRQGQLQVAAGTSSQDNAFLAQLHCQLMGFLLPMCSWVLATCVCGSLRAFYPGRCHTTFGTCALHKWVSALALPNPGTLVLVQDPLDLPGTSLTSSVPDWLKVLRTLEEDPFTDSVRRQGRESFFLSPPHCCFDT